MEETYVLTLEDKPKRFSELTLNFCGYSICQPRHSFGPAVRPGYILHFILKIICSFWERIEYLPKYF